MTRTTVVLLAFVTAATGCTGDDGSRPARTGASATAPGAPVVLAGTTTARGTVDLTAAGVAAALPVRVGDSFFDPTYVRAVPGATVSVTITNAGQRPHTFTVDGGADVTVQPGAEARATVTVPSGRAMRFYCRFHETGGMQGAFYSAAGQRADAPDEQDGYYGG